jgi:hypothetical protein
MKSLEYIDFDLAVLRNGEQYRARVLNSPAGQAQSDFDRPFSPLELENFLLRFGTPGRQTRRADTPEVDALKKFGASLFKAVFGPQVRAVYEQALMLLHERNED